MNKVEGAEVLLRSVGQTFESNNILETHGSVWARFDQATPFKVNKRVGEHVNAHLQIAGNETAAQRIHNDIWVATLVRVVASQDDEEGRHALKRLLTSFADASVAQ